MFLRQGLLKSSTPLVVIVLFLTLMVTLCLSIYSFWNTQKYDALVIDLAGRQRVLSQRYLLELLLQDSLDAKRNSIQIHELLLKTAKYLRDGGTVFNHMNGFEKVVLPRIGHIEIVQSLNQQIDLLEEIQKRAENLSISKINQFDLKQLQPLQGLTKEFLSIADQTTKLIRLEVQNKSKQLIGVTFFLLGCLILCGIVIFMFFYSRQKVEQELEGARSRAIEDAKIKAEFLANMSHEIRTPLNVIGGLLESLQTVHLLDCEKKIFEKIKSAANHLLFLVGDILDYSRIDSGYFRLNDAEFSVQELTDEVIQMMKPSAQMRVLKLNYDVDPKIPLILMGDSFRIKQVLLNLISNAIKFTPTGEITVRVMFGLIEKDKVELNFSVSDTGIGISEDYMKRLFERFNSYNQFRRNQEGTGLGLAISKFIVEQYGGNLTVQSIKDKGSTFSFNLFLKVPVSTQIKETPVPPKAPLVFIPPLKILVVDDNEENRFVVKLLLSEFPYFIEQASGGLEALNLVCADKKFDLILVDLKMPDMDGFALVERIRKFETEKKISATPILALTAHALESELSKAKEKGCSGYILKPVKKDFLISSIQKFAIPRYFFEENYLIKVDPKVENRSIIYLNRKKEEILKMKQALHEKDFAAIEYFGHNAAGSAASFGLEILGTMGRLLEHAARNTSDVVAKSYIETIERYLTIIKIETPPPPR